MLQLAHLYLNQKINGKTRIKEAVFWLEKAAMLDSDLVDVEKINNLKNNNTHTINPLPLYESSGINKEESNDILTTPTRVQSLTFIKDKARTSFSNSTTPLLIPQFNKERRKSLATTKINKKFTHNHSYSYSYGTSLTSLNDSNKHSYGHFHKNSLSPSSTNENQDFKKIELKNKDNDNTEENTESQFKNETEEIDRYLTEIENEINKKTEQDNDNKSQSQSSINSPIIMSPSIIEDISNLMEDDEDPCEMLSNKSDYFEKMNEKITISKNIQFNLQVQAEACFILYELYKNGYPNLLDKNLKLSKYYLNIASLNGSTKVMLNFILFYFIFFLFLFLLFFFLFEYKFNIYV